MTAVGKNDLQTQQAYSGQLRIQMAAISCWNLLSFLTEWPVFLAMLSIHGYFYTQDGFLLLSLS